MSDFLIESVYWATDTELFLELYPWTSAEEVAHLLDTLDSMDIPARELSNGEGVAVDAKRFHQELESMVGILIDPGNVSAFYKKLGVPEQAREIQDMGFSQDWEMKYRMVLEEGQKTDLKNVYLDNRHIVGLHDCSRDMCHSIAVAGACAVHMLSNAVLPVMVVAGALGGVVMGGMSGAAALVLASAAGVVMALTQDQQEPETIKRIDRAVEKQQDFRRRVLKESDGKTKEEPAR